MLSETTLRERQAQQVRDAIVEATLSILEASGRAEVSMAVIAKSAGVSLRTLYRYFPDRASLLQAAGEALYGSLQVPIAVAGPEDISSSFLDAAERLSARPGLTQTLVRTTAGRTVRSAVRDQRVKAIAAALEPVTTGLDDCIARQATAVITHLCSAASWVLVADESGMDDAEAQHAVAWAIDALVAQLHAVGEQPAGQPSRPGQRNGQRSGKPGTGVARP